MRTLMGTAALLLALAGCGDGDGADNDAADTSDIVACADLTGEPIEEGFEGCFEGDEMRPVSEVHECIDGTTLMLLAGDLGHGFDDGEWQTGSPDDAVSDCYGTDGTATDEPSEATKTPEPTDDSGEPTDEPDDAALPACEDVWIEGESLSADYDGCTEGGEEVLMVTISCKSGGELTTYADPETGAELYYALVGGIISPSADEEAKAADFTACFG